jgi:outer membrane protein assembly factor BamB
MKKRLLLSALIAVVSVPGWADWPQYLGPDRNGISGETGLARSWPSEGPKVLWTVELGPGYGGAAVVDGTVYLLDRKGTEGDVLRCLDLVTGTEKWSFSYGAPGRLSHPGSRSTPAVDGNYVYTCGPFGHVYCFDRRSKRPVWNKNVWSDFGGERAPRWGVSQNPVLYGDTVMLAAQTGEAGVVAYDKKSGAVRWKSSALPGGTGYVTPRVVKLAGEDQLVMITAGSSGRGFGGRSPRGGFSGRRRPGGFGGGRRPGGFGRGGPDRGGQSAGKGTVLGMDPKSGKTLWTYEGWQCRIPVPNVTPVGDGRLFVTGGYDAGSAMIKVEKKGTGFEVAEVYKTPDFGTHVHPAILYKGHLYGHCSTNSRRDGLVCMDLDGTVKWKTGREPSFDKGGFILADGLMLSIDGREGILYLSEPNPQGFKQLGRAKLLDTRECWAPLTLADGKLIIRDQDKMKCVAVK